MKKYFDSSNSLPTVTVTSDNENGINRRRSLPLVSRLSVNVGITDRNSRSSTSSSSSFSRRNSCLGPGCQPVNCQSFTGCESTSSSLCNCDPYVSRGEAVLKPITCCGPYENEYFSSPFQMKKIIPPKWISYGGMILKFYAYYQEPIFYSATETYRVHNCEIRYFLEDDTIEVVEPKTIDPGYPQGRVISRCRMPLPPPLERSYYTLDHMTVGCEIEFYGKVFYIQGCDDRTRQFLHREAYRVGPNMDMPVDPATEARREEIQNQFSRKGGINKEAIQRSRFEQHNRHVLRFWAYWVDDSSATCYTAITRKFVLNFYLVDDTIEILERFEPNSGYDEHSIFLNRGKLLKDYKKLHNLPGVREEALGILNVSVHDGCGGSFKPDTFLRDPLCPGIEELESYKADDLAIGAAINVYGRAFILVDCDEFTKRFYQDKFGIADFTPLEIPPDPNQEIPQMEIPPSIGFGNEEDTLGNWKNLISKKPNKNFVSEMLREKDILSFAAKLFNPLHNVNKDRRFTIRYFMADGTIQILEKAHRNTGFPSGTFLARGKIRFSEDPGARLIGYEDLYIGNTININGFDFQLLDADEFSLSLMEKLCEMFPQSNVDLILPKVRESLGHLQAKDVLDAFSCKDTQNMGVMDVEDFRGLILHYTQCGLNEHEVGTLVRAFRVEHPECGPDLDTLQAIIQNELSRFNFDKILLDRLRHSIFQSDACHDGLVDRETLRKALKGARLPVDFKLIDFLVDNFPNMDCCDRVCYEHVMQFLDWESHRCASTLPTPTPCLWRYIEPKPPMKILCVNYRALLDAVCPIFKCHLDSICPCPIPEPRCKPFEDPCPDEDECDDEDSDSEEQCVEFDG